MNKKVQNYLNENENSKLASIKNFISSHKEELKRAMALGLSTATVIGMLAGCNSFQNQNSNVTLTDESGNVITKVPGETMFPPIQTTRPTEEVIETGVTAEDVLAELNNICYNYMYEYFEDYKDQLGDKWEQMSCTFTTLGNNFVNKSGQTEDKEVRRPYINFLDRGISPADSSIAFRDVYKISVTMYVDANDRQNELRIKDIFVPAFAFESLMESFGKEQIIADRDYIHQFQSYMRPMIGDTLYDGLHIFDIKTIENANKDQLQHLYELTQCIKYYMQNKVPPMDPIMDWENQNSLN